MEFLWEFALTLAVSFLLPPIFIKLLSVSPCDDDADGEVAVSVTSRDRGVPSDEIQNWETEEVAPFSGKFNDSRGESTLEKLLEANCGSPYSEIEVVGLTENQDDESDQRAEIKEVGEEDGNWKEIDESKKNGVDSEKKELLEEDDWEGIESSELERLFVAAVLFVGSKSDANRMANLSNDVKMQLYGFHKIATEGPCQKPQPMALNFSARAKWY